MRGFFRAWSLIGIALFLSSNRETPLRAADWPQWRGVHRDAKSDESGLLQEWPKDGPHLAWKGTGLGRGYSSVSIADRSRSAATAANTAAMTAEYRLSLQTAMESLDDVPITTDRRLGFESLRARPN